MKKKILAGVLMLALTISMAACGEDKKEDKKDDKVSEQSQSIEEESEVGVSDNADEIESSEVADTDITNMSYDEAKAYLDSLPETDPSYFEITTDGMPEGEAAIDNYTGTDKIVVVPNTIDGLTITQFNTWSFTNDENINAVKAPDNLRVVDESAFCNCFNLYYVTNLNNVETIKNGAFIYTEVKTFEFSEKLTVLEGVWCDFIDGYYDEGAVVLIIPSGSYATEYAADYNDNSEGATLFEVQEY